MKAIHCLSQSKGSRLDGFMHWHSKSASSSCVSW